MECHRSASSVPINLGIDVGGPNPVHELRRTLLPAGTLAIVGGENGARLTGGKDRQLGLMFLSPFVIQSLKTFVANEQGSYTKWLGERLASDDIKPVNQRSYALDQVSEALADLAGGRVEGKAVIQIA